MSKNEKQQRAERPVLFSHAWRRKGRYEPALRFMWLGRGDCQTPPESRGREVRLGPRIGQETSQDDYVNHKPL